MLERIPVPEALTQLQAEQMPSSVTVLPNEWRDDRGLYRSELASLVKELRDAGVPANFYHSQDRRSWIDLRGTQEVSFAIALTIDLISSATWDGIKLALRMWLSSMPSVRRLKVDMGANGWWYKAEGSPDEVMEMFDQAKDMFKSDD